MDYLQSHSNQKLKLDQFNCGALQSNTGLHESDIENTDTKSVNQENTESNQFNCGAHLNNYSTEYIQDFLTKIKNLISFLTSKVTSIITSIST